MMIFSVVVKIRVWIYSPKAKCRYVIEDMGGRGGSEKNASRHDDISFFSLVFVYSIKLGLLDFFFSSSM